MDEIVVRYRWTADELVKANHWHSRHGTSRILGRLLWILVLFAIVGEIVLLLLGQSSVGSLVVTAGVIFFFGKHVARPWLIRRQFKNRPDREIEVELRISDGGIKNWSPLGTSEIQWSAYAKVVQTPEGYLFYPSPKIFYWLPRHGFVSDAEFDRLAEFVQKASVKYQKIS